MRRRGEVINYVTEKYGRDNVSQIITFGTMGAKAVMRDAGRGLDMPFAEVDRIAKLVPNVLNITLEDALEAVAGTSPAEGARSAHRRPAEIADAPRRLRAPRLNARGGRRDLAAAAAGNRPALQEQQG